MAGNVSKNAHREGAKVLMSRWGGDVAYCEKTGNTARKPKDLM